MLNERIIDLTGREYRVTEIVPATPTGQTLYKLEPINGGRDTLVSEYELKHYFRT